MDNDPLAKYRSRQKPAREQPVTENQKPPTTAHPFTPRPPTGLPKYEAFRVKDRKQERLEIRQVLHPWHMPGYRYLLDMSYDGRNGTVVNLIFSFMVVKVKGRNLQPVISAIGDGQCDFIQDFDARAFLEPEPGQPFIEKIELVRGEERE